MRIHDEHLRQKMLNKTSGELFREWLYSLWPSFVCTWIHRWEHYRMVRYEHTHEYWQCDACTPRVHGGAVRWIVYKAGGLYSVDLGWVDTGEWTPDSPRPLPPSTPRRPPSTPPPLHP